MGLKYAVSFVGIVGAEDIEFDQVVNRIVCSREGHFQSFRDFGYRDDRLPD